MEKNRAYERRQPLVDGKRLPDASVTNAQLATVSYTGD